MTNRFPRIVRREIQTRTLSCFRFVLAQAGRGGAIGRRNTCFNYPIIYNHYLYMENVKLGNGLVYNRLISLVWLACRR